jgi:BMFP domain-containing protein YqiC
MNQENVLKILAGARIVARKASKDLSEKSKDYIEQNIIKGNYVTREEFEQLKKLTLKIEKEMQVLIKTSKKEC